MREAHLKLLEGVKTLAAQLDEMDLEDQIEVGSVLWDLGDAVEETMKKLKALVRVAALQEAKGKTGKIELNGADLGTVAVTIMGPKLEVGKGKKMEDIKTALGDDFGLFFEEKVTVAYKVCKEFKELVKKMEDPLHQEALLAVVESRESTPRVSFRRFPSQKATNKASK
jgi:uncharacterized protein YcfJ